MLDRKRFALLLQALASSLGGELSPAMSEGYWIALRDLEPQAFEVASERALRTCKFFPRPVELRELAGAAETRDAAQDQAVLAWETVRMALGSQGRHRSVVFEDTAINAAIHSLGGWVRLGGLEDDDFNVWARKQFCADYARYALGGVPAELQRHHPGIAELGNGPAHREAPVVVRSLTAPGPMRAIPAGREPTPEAAPRPALASGGTGSAATRALVGEALRRVARGGV